MTFENGAGPHRPENGEPRGSDLPSNKSFNSGIGNGAQAIALALDNDLIRRCSAFAAELVLWAKAYAAQGLPVFPISAANKIPNVKWSTEATTDAKQIVFWWQRWPLAMIGMPTGKRSGYVVLDIDRKNNKDGFATLLEKGWDIPRNAVEVCTPSGGGHFYFRLKPGQEIRNSASKIGPGVDIRGEGGLVILPPSRRRLDGPDYHFVEGQGADGAGLCARQLQW